MGRDLAPNNERAMTMTTATHTPGPWQAHGKTVSTPAQNAKGWKGIAKTWRPENARLIACAPGMLAALKLAQAALNTAPRFRIPSLPKEHDDSYKVAAVVDAAVRAAEGGK
jgi:hypothetical protein